jgi:hypothetical protein
LRDTLVIVGKENFDLLAPTTTILLPYHVTSRHPRDREGVQCNIREGFQEHGEVSSKEKGGAERHRSGAKTDIFLTFSTSKNNAIFHFSAILSCEHNDK